MPQNPHISFDETLEKLSPITLEEMDSIKLMNRIDSKYLTNENTLLQLLERAAAVGYRVLVTQGTRINPYDSIYFDTAGLRMFYDHHNRRLVRQKVRTRCYENSGDAFLEIKRKNNHGRTKKKRVDMVGFDPMHPDHGIRFLRQDEQYRSYDEFLRKHLRYDPTVLSERLENHFNRITLVNKAKTERLTIDTGLCFHNLITGRDVDLTGLAIIELKRDGLQPSPILGMLRDLRIKPSGFSKYCMGSALTNPALKRNNFNERLHMIERLLCRVNRY